MASRAPRSLVETRRDARGIDPCVEVRGFREIQMRSYLHAYIETHGVSPSYAIARDDLGFCDESGVLRVIERLERKGEVRRIGKGRQRRIQLIVNNK